MQRVDDYEHVAELRLQNSAVVVAPVFRPYDVHLIVAEVPHLRATIKT